MIEWFANLTPARLALLGQGVGMTLFLAFVGVLIGMCGGVLGGILSCRRLRHPILSALISTYVFIVQGTPLFVQILLVYFALPTLWGGAISPVAAVLVALGANSTAYITQIVRAGINAVPAGQWEAAFVLGYSTRGALWHIILPQMARNVFPALLNEVISLVKETSIVGAIGVYDLTKVIRDLVNRTMEPLGWYLCAAVMYLIITSVLGLIAKVVERRLEYDHR